MQLNNVETSMTKSPEEIIRAIKAAIENDEIVLPTLPEMAMKAREAAQNPDISILALSKVLENDMTISARIIKIANSPLYRSAKENKDLKAAIGRLGIATTASLVSSLAMEQMFQATTDYVDKRLRTIWNKSTEVSGIAYALCRRCTKLKPDQATLAGLIHEIGALPILTYAEDHTELFENELLLERLIEKAHPHLGSHILKQWDFPAELQQVPKGHLNLKRAHDGPADFADLVTVANLQYVREEPKHPLANVDWAEVPAFSKLGIDPSEELFEEEDLSAEMEAATAMLRA